MWLFLLLLTTSAEPASSAPATSTCVLPAGTEVLLETTEEISSATARIGQHVSYRLAEPIATGQAPVPVGQPATGDIVHAAHASWSGRAGELILAARYIE